ncbi:MAG: UDP-glucose 4-epimerase GalE [Firmicutes bacterium]|nr:UDP-glucose 4-epimerase GalE [Bacillota bacterium]
MILVTGGAGYIGSHVVKSLINKNYNVVVIDNLTTGHIEAVDKRAIFVQGDLENLKDLEIVFSTYPVKGVIHLAGKCYVQESVLHPLMYYQANVVSSINLLKYMLKYQVNNIVFSSSCSVYGIPNSGYIAENAATNPINPYGRSKLIIEFILQDFAKAYGLNYIILRYFNAAGSDLSGEIGEDHNPETHLIPSIVRHLLGLAEKVVIYGDDYQTKDSTCVRDFIHVSDLANAHIKALEQLLQGRIANEIFNLGKGEGYSVKEIIGYCEKISGKRAIVERKERREGDPPGLVACSKKAYCKLGWKPVYNIEDIIRSAWQWHRNHPCGYQSGYNGGR